LDLPHYLGTPSHPHKATPLATTLSNHLPQCFFFRSGESREVAPASLCEGSIGTKVDLKAANRLEYFSISSFVSKASNCGHCLPIDCGIIAVCRLPVGNIWRTRLAPLHCRGTTSKYSFCLESPPTASDIRLLVNIYFVIFSHMRVFECKLSLDCRCCTQNCHHCSNGADGRWSHLHSSLHDHTVNKSSPWLPSPTSSPALTSSPSLLRLLPPGS